MAPQQLTAQQSAIPAPVGTPGPHAKRDVAGRLPPLFDPPTGRPVVHVPGSRARRTPVSVVSILVAFVGGCRRALARRCSPIRAAISDGTIGGPPGRP